MRLGGWESLDMVLRHTGAVKFEDSLKLYQSMNAFDAPVFTSSNYQSGSFKT